jgi:hypothetical protein
MTASLRRPRDVAVVAAEGLGEATEPKWYVARLPDGPLVVLDGTAAVVWSEAFAGSEDSLAERVAQHLLGARAGADDLRDAAEEIRADVAEFVAGLIRDGLLERHTAYSTP